MRVTAVTEGVGAPGREAAKKALRIVISLSLFAIVIGIADWRAVAGVLKSASPKWVAVALALVVVDRMVLNWRWQVLLAAQGVPVAFGRLFRVQLAANFFGSFLPTSVGVDAVRVATLCRSHPMAPVVAATLVDRVSIVVATLLFGSTMILLLAQSRLPSSLETTVLSATVLILLLGAIVLLPSVRRWVRLAVLPRVPARFARTFAAIAEASLLYRRTPRAWAAVGIITLVLLVGRVAFAKCLAMACGVDVPFTQLLMVVPVLWILVMLPITIGGLGVQDVGYVALMALVGVSAPVAVSMSLLEHVLTRLVSLPGAFLIETPRLRAA